MYWKRPPKRISFLGLVSLAERARILLIPLSVTSTPPMLIKGLRLEVSNTLSEPIVQGGSWMVLHRSEQGYQGVAVTSPDWSDDFKCYVPSTYLSL